MPAWLVLLFWRIRGKRKVRLLPADGAPTWEGVLAGCTGGRDGHYILLAPRLLEEENASHALGGFVEVPRERVLAVQVL